MKNKILLFSLLLTGIVTLVNYGCQKDEPVIQKAKIIGSVQKGPFISGTSILLSELNTSLSQTGKIFTSLILDNSGSFELTDISLSSRFVALSASGYYFDEVKGEISASPLTLFALSDIADISTINVNILTHLEKQRVEYLIKHNQSFTIAKKKAQEELLGIFGISLTEMDKSENLDITKNTESNAVLLAVSVILQGDRSVGDLTELMAIISEDFREDGILNNESINSTLRSSTKELNLQTIRTNLQTRYNELDENVTIPSFEKYVNQFLTYTGQKPSAIATAATNITLTEARLNATINANSLSTSAIFEYGRTIEYGDSIVIAQGAINGYAPAKVYADIAELIPGRTYHFRIKTKNTLGITYSSDMTFKTLGDFPWINCKAPTNLTTTSATFNASVNANYLNTTVCFTYICSCSLDEFTVPAMPNPVTGSVPVNISGTVTGLLPGTLYNYRVKAENSVGVVISNEIIFTTLGKVPDAQSTNASDIHAKSAIINGIVNPNYLSTSCRFEYGTSTDYEFKTNIIQNSLIGGNEIAISALIDFLKPGTIYHYRIKAENEFGITYSEDMSFETLDTIKDFEGNIYPIIKIGTQTWMAENLKSTRFNDGSHITNITDGTIWDNSYYLAAYCWYNNDEAANKNIYGALYNFNAVKTAKLCPTGWHVPEYSETKILLDYLGGANQAGPKLREQGTLWEPSPNTFSNNSSGFSARPGGGMYGPSSQAMGKRGEWWLASREFVDDWIGVVNCMAIFAGDATVYYHNQDTKLGFSVRCIKDE